MLGSRQLSSPWSSRTGWPGGAEAVPPDGRGTEHPTPSGPTVHAGSLLSTCPYGCRAPPPAPPPYPSLPHCPRPPPSALHLPPGGRRAGCRGVLCCPFWWVLVGTAQAQAGLGGRGQVETVGLVSRLQGQGGRSRGPGQELGQSAGPAQEAWLIADPEESRPLPLPLPQACQEVLVRELYQPGEGGADFRGHQGQSPELHQSRHRSRLPVGEPPARLGTHVPHGHWLEPDGHCTAPGWGGRPAVIVSSPGRGSTGDGGAAR